MNDLFGEVFKPYMPAIQLGQRLFLLFFIVFWVALVFWTWRDAQRRGAMPWFWATVALLFNVAGWAIYMVVRPPESREDARERELEIRAREAELTRANPVCPACFKPVDPDFLICPSCMKKLKKECTSCGKPLKLDWAVCPYCKTKQ
ncbi:MAG: zinc ribbon domain-containing protein [Actinomycetia bacterium]|nr:zinc ribbon domain-containing protein [Actinomycetes bacterium]